MPNQYKKRRIRVKDYDYSQPDYYFFTTSTFERKCLFGEIHNGEVELNTFGCIVLSTWDVLPDHYPNVELDVFIVMPNHVHGIIILNEADPTTEKVHGLTEIVRNFKSFSSWGINRVRNTHKIPVWQRGFHERVIRTDRQLEATRKYIVNNPAKWAWDRENPKLIKR